MRVPNRPTPGPVGSALVLVAVFAFVGIIGSCAITIGIWPGELKLLAPIFCTDAQPDPFVVADTYSPQPGETTTNFTLYCMGPRGDATDKGFLLPFLAISVVNGVVLMSAGFAIGRLAMRRTRRRRGGSLGEITEGAVTTGPGPGSTAGPFVD